MKAISITEKTITIERTGDKLEQTVGVKQTNAFYDHKKSCLASIDRLEKLATSLSNVGLTAAYNVVTYECNYLKESLLKTERAMGKTAIL